MTSLITSISRDSFKDHPLFSRLLELHDIPKVFNIKGRLPEVTIDEYGRATPRILTIVGSRKNTSYGRNVVEKLVASLQGEDVVILSGLALGIDGIAHRAAIDNNLITICIPGSGIDDTVLYPSTHINLAHEIIEKGGALFSELDTTSKAALWTFPQRNRVMAALSDAVLIIEAEEKSGTLITARQALELGRDIGAIPGEIFSPSAYGPNMLIREGAYAITSINDLFDLLHLSKKETMYDIIVDEKSYTANETLILNLLLTISNKDTLFLATKLSFEDFIISFSSLEIDGRVEETFGEVRRLV